MPAIAGPYPIAIPINNGSPTNISKEGKPIDCILEMSTPAALDSFTVICYNMTTSNNSKIKGFKPYLRAFLTSCHFTLR